jgi:SnoaL-like protein
MFMRKGFSFDAHRILFFLVLLFLTACKDRSRPMDKSSIEKEINNTIENYYRDISKKGLLAEFKYLDSSENFFWVAPGYSTHLSYDSVSAVIKRNAASLKSVDNSLDNLLVKPLTDNLASFTMRTRSTIVDTSGAISKIAFLETGIMIKRNDGWKFLSGQTSLIPE